MSLLNGLLFAPVLITDVFDSMRASKAWFDRVHLKKGTPAIPYLSQTFSNNGVADMIGDQGVAPERGNCITITLKTQATFYQPVAFYSAQNFLVFRHELLDEFSGLVLVASLRKAMEKFSWGYGVSMVRLRKTRIMVPVTSEVDGAQVVDWKGMRELGAEMRSDVIEKADATRAAMPAVSGPLPTFSFAPLLVTELFETVSASSAWFDKNKVRSGEGGYPYVSRSAVSNGHESVIGSQAVPPNRGNAITIGVDTQTVFYQPTPFYTSVKIQVLRHGRLNPDNGPILVAILRAQMTKFQWGNGVSLDRLRITRVMVPVVSFGPAEGEVDWDGMDEMGKMLRARAESSVAPTLLA